MYYKGVINNSMLHGAIETMRLDPTPENHTLVLEEVLKATYLCPALLSAPPLMDEKGEPYFAEGCDVQYQMLQNSQGKPFLIAFTDPDQAEKWKARRTAPGEVYELVMEFSDYINLIMRPLPGGGYGPAEGVVIDPFGANLKVDRDMVANLVIRRMQEQEREEQIRQAQREASAQNIVQALEKENIQEGSIGSGEE